MLDVPNIIGGFFLFVTLFFEVFLLFTLFENKKELKHKPLNKTAILPTATIVVPCFNEQESIFATIESLLSLDYPKDKLKILIVDDGSTDNSWDLIQRYKNHPQIELHKKENGGKHTVLNYAISKSTSDIIGCLDADSFVCTNALKDIVAYFEDKEVMSVIPAVKVFKPDNILRKIQKVEYDWGVFLRKMYSFLNAIYVTPGPFSFFRKEVFEKIGPYRHAHNTEDMEIAMRMQNHNLKIVNCHTASVYTIAPDRLGKLIKQRLRWTYGFLRNAIDYKHVFFSHRHGNLGFFVFPILAISTASTLWMTSAVIREIFISIKNQIYNWGAINFSLEGILNYRPNFEWFYINTNPIAVIIFITFIISLSMVLIGRRLSEGKIKPSMDLVYYVIIYPFIAPIWVFRAVYNLVIGKRTSWR